MAKKPHKYPEFRVIGGPFDGGTFMSTENPNPKDGDAWNYKAHIYRFDGFRQVWVCEGHVLQGFKE